MLISSSFMYLCINTCRTVDSSQQIRLSEVALLHVVHSRERSTSDTFALLAILVLVSARVEPGYSVQEARHSKL